MIGQKHRTKRFDRFVTMTVTALASRITADLSFLRLRFAFALLRFRSHFFYIARGGPMLIQSRKFLPASIHLPALLIVAVALVLISPAAVMGEPSPGKSGSAVTPVIKRIYYVDGRPCVLTDEEAEDFRENGSVVEPSKNNGRFSDRISMKAVKYACFALLAPLFLLGALGGLLRRLSDAGEGGRKPHCQR